MSYNYNYDNNQGGYYNGPPPTISYGNEDSGYEQQRAGGGFPGQYSSGGYNGYPGGGGYQYDQQQNYQPPTGPPPGQYNNQYSNQYNNQYGPPQGPPPPQQQHWSQQPQQQGGGYQRPPTHQQSGAAGQTFRYSACTGRRKALCIGINYIGSSNALRGCINDARAVSAFLQDRYGYKDDDIVLLTDDQRDPRSHPTRANMLRGMQWLVNGAEANDTLFLHYSGHGGQTQDVNGDEDDGYDEVIYPVDFKQAGHITDDDMHAILVRPLREGVRLTCLFDSCHSGTVLDLPFTYATDGSVKQPNLAKDGLQTVVGALASYSHGDIGDVVKGLGGFLKKATVGKRAEEESRRVNFSPADVIMLSGCKDSQTSADAVNGGTATGAMSYSFITVMTRDSNQSFISLLNEMRKVMAGRYSQLPQLSSSHPVDTNLKFIM